MYCIVSASLSTFNFNLNFKFYFNKPCMVFYEDWDFYQDLLINCDQLFFFHNVMAEESLFDNSM